jgi:hypothetical protein
MADIAPEAATLVLARLNKRNEFITPVLGYLSNEPHAADAPVNATHFEMFICKVADCVLVFRVI